MRVAFGAALLASVTIVWTAIIAVMSSQSSDDRRSSCVPLESSLCASLGSESPTLQLHECC